MTTTIPPAIAARNLELAKALHPDLIRLYQGMVAAGFLFALTTTHRGAVDQAAAKAAGNSRAAFGQSPHNFIPALAFDCYPLVQDRLSGPVHIDVNNAGALDAQAPRIKLLAAKLGIAITWGGDWKSIIDRPHFELTNWKALRTIPR